MPQYRLPNGEVVTVPDGTTPAMLNQWLKTRSNTSPGGPTTTPPPTAPTAAPLKPVATGGGRGTGLDVRTSNRVLKENAPAVGAALATMAGPTGWIPALTLAGGGGYLGARARGDTRGASTAEGAKQAVYQMAPRVVEGLSRAVYKSGIPKAILDKFRKADVVGAGLENRAVLGTTTGVNTAERAGQATAREVQAAAGGVRPMTVQDVQAAFRPKYNEALIGRRPDKAIEISDHVKQSMHDIGLQPMSGVQQLARKAQFEPEAGSAMRAVSEKMAATNPQLANIERRAITQNLRQSPEMAQALNRAQANVGLKRAALMTEHSNPFTRMVEPGGGLTSTLRMPMASSIAGIAGHELSRALNPEVTRALMALLSQRSNPDE